MANRFGFNSVKKPLQEQNHHRMSDYTPSVRGTGGGGGGGGGFSAHGGLINSVSSVGSSSAYSAHGLSSMRKLSTGGKLGGGGGGGGLGLAAPSTGKSIRSMGGFASSARKTPTSKLFGMTPQQTRASFSQGGVGGAFSTGRRSSTRGGKPSERPLSDPNFHRKCQEKIATFLESKEYPIPLTAKQLARPSQADVSRIFEFLFSFFATEGHPRLEIRNGPTTSIDVVVPRMLAELAYPYTLKRSDLVSFSGGRQLGAVLEAICYVIDIITYIDNVDINRFSKKAEGEEEFGEDISAQLREIALANAPGGAENGLDDDLDDDNLDEENDPDMIALRKLADSVFGTRADVEQLKAAQVPLEERLEHLDKEINRLVELPKEIQEYKEDNENYDKYLAELAAKDADHQRLRAELLAELAEKEAALEGLAAEKRRLQAIIDGQKETVVEWRLAKERRRQIETEAEEAKAAVAALNEQLITASLELNEVRSLNRALIDDIKDVIDVFFAQLKASKVNLASERGDFASSFEADAEWQALAAQLAVYRDWTVEAAPGSDDQLVREVAAFGGRFQEKLNDFKNRLLRHLSAFKGTASIEVICERQKLARELEADRLALAKEEAELAALVTLKERTEEEGEAAIARLNAQIDQAKVAILGDEREVAALTAEVATLEEAVEQLEAEITRRRMDWARNVMAPLVERTETEINEYIAAHEAMLAEGRAAAAEKERRLAEMRAYNTKKKVQKKVVASGGGGRNACSAAAEGAEPALPGGGGGSGGEVAEMMEAVENIAIED